jgi:curli biogenesis system outer membrane secretion channel CsgG
MRKTLTALFLSLMVFLVSCATGPVSYTKGAPLAVWDLEDLSPSAGGNAGLGELLSSRIMETLQQRGDFTIIERERLLLALQELHLGSSSLSDESTRLKLGKLMGAQFMVFGCFQIIGEQMRLDLRVVNVETGKIVKGVHKETSAADLQEWSETAKKAAEEL